MTRLSPERDGSAGPGWELLNRLLFDSDEKALRRVLLVLAAVIAAVVVVLVVVGFVAREVGTSLELGGLVGAGATLRHLLRHRRHHRQPPGVEDPQAED